MPKARKSKSDEIESRNRPHMTMGKDSTGLPARQQTLLTGFLVDVPKPVPTAPSTPNGLLTPGNPPTDCGEAATVKISRKRASTEDDQIGMAVHSGGGSVVRGGVGGGARAVVGEAGSVLAGVGKQPRFAPLFEKEYKQRSRNGLNARPRACRQCACATYDEFNSGVCERCSLAARLPIALQKCKGKCSTCGARTSHRKQHGTVTCGDCMCKKHPQVVLDPAQLAAHQHSLIAHIGAPLSVDCPLNLGSSERHCWFAIAGAHVVVDGTGKRRLVCTTELR